MPSRETVDRFVAQVESGAMIETMEEFYAPEATMRENLLPPRIGRVALIEHERQALAGVSAVSATAVRPYLIEGDIVVVRWVFVFTGKDGRATRLEELAYQRWQNEQIVEEQFFYDPGQLKSRR